MSSINNRTANRIVHSVRTTDREALIVGVASVVCLLGAFISFLAGSSLTAVFIAGFLLVVGYGWYARQALTAKGLTFLATVSTLLTMGLIIVFVLREALPAIRYMGLIDLISYTNEPMWNTGGEQIYSLAPALVGTVVETLLAVAIAGPLGVAGALFISEVAPGWLREILKPGIEILAGIPSIVFGYLGLVVLNPYFSSSSAFGLPGLGSLFAVGLVVGVMALPTVVSVAEDAISSVPESMKQGSLALGATDWQTMTGITMPAAFSGISAAVLLGVGRAVGETMAATVILGNVTELPTPVFDVFDNTITLTSLIASQYGNASGLHVNALFAAGAVLFVTVMVISVVSQMIERRMVRRLGGRQ
jgi:phosphate transport system permease protein